MTFLLSVADPADAARIAEIHMAAFGSNAMLIAQFPTPAVRDALQKTIEWKALADIKDPKVTVLVVTDPNQPGLDVDEENTVLEQAVAGQPAKGELQSRGKVISFAKWSHPVGQDEDYAEAPWIWPEGTQWDVLDGWIQKLDEVQARLLGKMPCYQLSFIGTDPAYMGQGAGSLMVQWGIEQSQKDGAAAYVESTIEAAPFYEKNGFTAVEKFAVDLKGTGGETKGIYEEISFMFKPSTMLA